MAFGSAVGGKSWVPFRHHHAVESKKRKRESDAGLIVSAILGTERVQNNTEK